MDPKLVARAEWGIKTLEVDIEELTARLGPRLEWFEIRCYVWNFEEFKKLLEKFKVPEAAKFLDINGIRVHEDKNLAPGVVETRLVPKMGRAFGSIIQ